MFPLLNNRRLLHGFSLGNKGEKGSIPLLRKKYLLSLHHCLSSAGPGTYERRCNSSKICNKNSDNFCAGVSILYKLVTHNEDEKYEQTLVLWGRQASWFFIADGRRFNDPSMTTGKGPLLLKTSVAARLSTGGGNVRW